MRVLFTSPAYHPAASFGGPIVMARELNEGMVRRGHAVDVLTTTLVDIETGITLRGRTDDIGGVHVRYLATPLRYRWMGITPSAPLALARLGRPEVCHIFGFRDPLGTLAALWCRAHRIPYLLEPLGMFAPRVRKIGLKRALDRSALRPVVTGAALIVATSEVERDAILAAGGPGERVAIRRNGFPAPPSAPSGRLRRELGLDREPLVLYVGRIAAGKGIEFLLDAARAAPDAHFAFVGPDDAHGVGDLLEAAGRAAETAGRIHVLGRRDDVLELYGDADVFALPSSGESFGMAGAEAAAAGTAVVVTDRCGVAEVLRDGAALVVPYEREAIVEAVTRVLRDDGLREGLARRGREVALSHSWPHIVERQEALYLQALRRA